MTTEPIRFLDDPSVALELREFMQDQAPPEALSDGARRMVEGRIAASVLALPLSMKLGGLLSPGATTTGTGSITGGAVSASAGAGSVGAGSVGAGSVGAGSVGAGSALGSGVIGVAGASVAPVGAGAAGSALAATTLTAVGAKGVGLVGALSVTKGVAVLGLAVATGGGAAYVVKDVGALRSESTELRSGGAQFAEVQSEQAGLDASAARRSRAVRIGQPAAPVATEHGRVEQLPTERGESTRSSGAELSLEDLEELPQDVAVVGQSARQVVIEVGSDSGLGRQDDNASERLQEEVELLRRAQQLLRVDRVLAAEALERYDAKFPKGAMRAEYDVLRRRLLSQP